MPQVKRETDFTSFTYCIRPGSVCGTFCALKNTILISFNFFIYSGYLSEIYVTNMQIGNGDKYFCTAGQMSTLLQRHIKNAQLLTTNIKNRE